jgi:hypothetical protein
MVRFPRVLCAGVVAAVLFASAAAEPVGASTHTFAGACVATMTITGVTGAVQMNPTLTAGVSSSLCESTNGSSASLSGTTSSGVWGCNGTGAALGSVTLFLGSMTKNAVAVFTATADSATVEAVANDDSAAIFGTFVPLPLSTTCQTQWTGVITFEDPTVD